MSVGGQSRGGFGCDPGIESSRVVRSAYSCLPGEDSDGSGDARVASVVRKIPPILVGMPEKMVNNFYALSRFAFANATGPQRYQFTGQGPGQSRMGKNSENGAACQVSQSDYRD